MKTKDIEIIQKSDACAVIYARVSSTAQVSRGHGLGSQETRCRDFAKAKGYEIADVFCDEGVSGGMIDRPGMQAMLAFLKQHKSRGDFVVIIDDISRLARDMKAHLELRAAIADAGARLESPSVEFGEDSDSILVENLLASVSQHSRQKNAEQVVNRMKARVQAGYYIFAPVIGYRYDKVDGHGKMLVPDEPNASIVREALEGFASGRFQTVSEVKRFLERFPTTPRNKHGEVRVQLVCELLRRPLYAGYISLEKWDLHLHPGKHEPLISFKTFQKIQERLDGVPAAPFRKDINADFPLRGFVECGECGNALTACWSKGRSARYPYYLCQTKGCSQRNKSIRKEKIEEEFADLVATLQPRRALFDVVYDMLREIWEHMVAGADSRAAKARFEIGLLDRKSEQIMERIMAADSPALITAYEEKIKMLEAKKTALHEAVIESGKPKQSFDALYRTACAFLANPWKLWESGVLAQQRLMLRLVFPQRLAYVRDGGYRTGEIAMPFRVLEGLRDNENGVVGPEGLEPPT
ncbi:MAG: recombinase family protein [Pseudomonadota bacterium]